MFSTSKNSIKKVIASFESLKSSYKKYCEDQLKGIFHDFINLKYKFLYKLYFVLVFESIHHWSCENSNNIGIQDVSEKMVKISIEFNDKVSIEREESIQKMIDIFQKFKEYDAKVETIKKKNVSVLIKQN
jgi:hypothetical protein